MSAVDRITALLPESLLETLRERAAGYDSQNRFFTEDFDDLKTCGYLAAGVPTSFGGGGLSLTELAEAQRRLAAAAPATALGVNMHLVWGAVACLMRDRGHHELDWVLQEIVAGETFAFGISEPGNDAVLMDAHTRAVPNAGGYLISGTKVFTTLSPVWTRLGVHAVVADEQGDIQTPRTIVFGFIEREAQTGSDRVRKMSEGSAGLLAGRITHPGIWNPLGMRATQSWATALEQVPLPSQRVAAVVPPMTVQNPVVFAIFAAFSTLTAAVYAGIADRALAIARDAVNRLHTFADGTEAPLVSDPEVATRLGAATLEHECALDGLELLTRALDEGRETQKTLLKLSAMRNRVTDQARRAVEIAMRYVGTRGFQADSELARLYRDVLAGLFHPTSSRALAQMVRGTLSD